MKAFLAATALLVTLAACGIDSAETAETGDAQLYSVLFYADWCPSCKKLDPAINEARRTAKLDQEAVLFVTLDLTNDITRAQSKMLARALGLGELFAENAGKTGYAVLVDTATGATRATLTKAMGAAEIAAAVNGELGT